MDERRGEISPQLPTTSLNTRRPTLNTRHLVYRGALLLPLLSFFALQVAFVTILAIGRPLDVWDSWVTWGMKARTVFP